MRDRPSSSVIRFAHLSRIFAPLLLAIMLCSCASHVRVAPALTRLESAEVVLPAEPCEGYFYLEVFTPAGGPYSFVLDTGAGITVVSPAFAEQHSQHSRRVATVLHGAEADEVRVSTAVHIPRLTIGSVDFSRFDAVVVDLDDLSDAIGRPIDGILGYPVFRDLALTLDYPGGQIRVSRAVLGDGFNVFPMTRWRPVISARIAGRSHRLLIDSGSSECVAIGDGFDSLPMSGRVVATTPSVTIGGVQEGDVTGRLAADAAMGGVVIKNPIVSRTNGMSRLGVRALEHFVVTLDQRSSRVRLGPGSAGEIHIPSLRGTGARFRKRGDAWTVWTVMPGSPADAAGLVPGDLVVLVEGQDPGAMLCTGLGEIMRRQNTITLRIERDGRTRTARVGVVDLVP